MYIVRYGLVPKRLCRIASNSKRSSVLYASWLRRILTAIFEFNNASMLSKTIWNSDPWELTYAFARRYTCSVPSNVIWTRLSFHTFIALLTMFRVKSSPLVIMCEKYEMPKSFSFWHIKSITTVFSKGSPPNQVSLTLFVEWRWIYSLVTSAFFSVIEIRGVPFS